MGRKETLAERQKRWNAMVSEKAKWMVEEQKKLLETRDKSIPELKEFYAGLSVLITGGTGFLGKVLIEKLLRSVHDLDKIYVIVRPKRGQNAAQRLETLFNIDVSFIHQEY